MKGRLAAAFFLASAASAPAQTTPAENEPGIFPPLSALSETRDRPLFSPTRRPPPLAPVIEASPLPILNAPPAPELAAPDKPPFTLVGAIVGGAQRIAILQDSGSGALATAREGDMRGAWTVVQIGRRNVVVSVADRRVTLELPAPSGVASQPAAAAVAPPPTEDSLTGQAPPARKVEKAH